MSETIKLQIVCQSCSGTGLYIGLAEQDGAAVICFICKGTGCQEYEFKYEDFVSRKKRNDVVRVHKTSGGYCLSGKDVEVNGVLIEFSKGGVSYEEWLAGKQPTPMKKLYCPLQWTNQQWFSPLYCKDKYFGGLISECPYRKEHGLTKCWEEYRKEHEAAISGGGT